MFMNDVRKKEKCKEEILLELQMLEVKFRLKKPPKQPNFRRCNKLFRVHLGLLPREAVTLKTGQQLPVPKLVHQLCSFILTKVNTEGIFRKEGSKSRQVELKSLLDRGGVLSENDNVIDVAVLLKTFFRELPESLIPYDFQSLFLRCTSSEVYETTLQALLLACLVLPLEHLNTLTYLLQFLHEVADNSAKNKMDAYNLAVVIGPNIFPVDPKLNPHTAHGRTLTICTIIQILIENSVNVGVLPEAIVERLSSSPKKKKRRSGSLTRMFNGLRKIVGGKSVEENHNVVTPDLLLTPISNNTQKKRRLQASGISNKKKKELLNKFPDNALLSTPFTPCRTPVSMDLSGQTEKQLKRANDVIKEKKSQWFLRSRSVKNLKCEESTDKNNINTKTALERRWSAIAHPNNTKKTKKRNSFAAPSAYKKKISDKNKENCQEPDYIRVPKIEYEAIKNRVSAMERRISMELESVQSQIETDGENTPNVVEVDTNIDHVQAAYEQTLVQSEHLSPTTDQLAKRLSRELKIRRSAEQKIIRSPSARKIGSMRRKSKELEKNSFKIIRHQSWHVPANGSIPRVSLKRGRPNTVFTGLPVNRVDNGVSETQQMTRTRSSSVGEHFLKGVSCNTSGSSSDTWMSAEGFFETLRSKDSSSVSGRASLARLRSQNVGMVLAKAKLFDQLKSSDSSGSLTRPIPKTKANTKIGSNRNFESRQSYRLRTLKQEERRLARKSMSPRRRNLSQKQKLQIAKQYLDSSTEKNSDKENIPDNINNLDKRPVVPLKDCNRMDGQKVLSPKYQTPHIKKSLNVKSPKRLCRTPVRVERTTPLRVLKTPSRHNHV